LEAEAQKELDAVNEKLNDIEKEVSNYEVNSLEKGQ
jgi:translation elongation factor EF-1beta